MKPVLKRSPLELLQRRKRFPIKSRATGKVKKMKVRVLGKARLENLLTKGKSPAPAKNPK
jgi:hypothetical protein